ncbi:MAG: hypothetical protein Q9174_005029 [Haloplaca sp. 1 TL-2023]
MKSMISEHKISEIKRDNIPAMPLLGGPDFMAAEEMAVVVFRTIAKMSDYLIGSDGHQERRHLGAAIGDLQILITDSQV